MSLGVIPQVSSSDAEVGNIEDRKQSLTGDDSDLELFQQWQALAVIPLKEDVAEWLNKTLGMSMLISQTDFEESPLIHELKSQNNSERFNS